MNNEGTSSGDILEQHYKHQIENYPNLNWADHEVYLKNKES